MTTAPLSLTNKERLLHDLGLSHTITTWLTRQATAQEEQTSEGSAALERFLNPKLAHLTNPDAMADRDAAALRLAQAVREKQRIVVFGDYDCDGITSAAILTEVLHDLGAETTPLLASRFDGGYGVSRAAAQRIVSKEPALLVTCDCGSSDHESLAWLGSRGIDVVVIDHHLVPEKPLPALAFLNPHRPECGFPYKGLASCGLALSVAAALRKALGVNLDLKRWLDLVAIGTIADVAPLNGDNRALVKAGLQALREAQRPGVRALLSLAKISTELPLSGRDVAFRIAPHLNAPGRMGPADLALQLLLAQSDEQAQALAAEVQLISAQRKAQQEELVEQATQEIETAGYHTEPAIVIGREGWNAGVVGIVAGRLADRFERPVIVVGFEQGHGRGSVRGPAGIRLFDAVADTADCLVRFGGHQAAAGLEVSQKRLEELRMRFCQAVQRQARPEPARQDDTLDFDERDDPLLVLADLDRLEPCGEKNPRPRLRVKGRVISAREVSGGHLKLALELGSLGLGHSPRLGGFALNQGHRANSLDGPIVVTGDLRHTAFPGSGGVEMFVEQIE